MKILTFDYSEIEKRVLSLALKPDPRPTVILLCMDSPTGRLRPNVPEIQEWPVRKVDKK